MKFSRLVFYSIVAWSAMTIILIGARDDGTIGNFTRKALRAVHIMPESTTQQCSAQKKG